MAATAADSHATHFALHRQAMTFTAIEGVKCYKTYRRGAKTFWRNYHRTVPGGVSFLQRFDAALEDHAARHRAYLTQAIFTRGEAAGRSAAEPAS